MSETCCPGFKDFGLLGRAHDADCERIRKVSQAMTKFFISSAAAKAAMKAAGQAVQPHDPNIRACVHEADELRVNLVVYNEDSGAITHGVIECLKCGYIFQFTVAEQPVIIYMA